MDRFQLKIASWNIQGLMTRMQPTNSSISNSKLNVKLIRNKIQQFDIVCLQETWLKTNDINFPDYCVYNAIQETRSKRGCRGVSIFIKNSINPHIEIIRSKTSNILWCKD